MRRLVVFAAAAALALAASMGSFGAPADAQTTLPPSLQGEFLFAGGTHEVDCPTPTGGGTYSWSVVAGIAVGPYSGTYTETGTVTFGALVLDPANVHQPILDFHVSFEIDSPLGHVTGTKSIGPNPDDLRGGCGTGSSGHEFAQLEGPLVYDAQIVAVEGTFRDSGTAFISNSAFCPGGGECVLGINIESFVLSNGLLPLDTTGKATGGGQLGDVTSPAHVSFGFEVKQPELGKLQGRCVVNDSASNTRVKCLDVTSYSQVGNTATWTGHAEVNGAAENYRITVQDNGEPNQGIDTFAFHSDSYDAAGNVQYGNVQLHKQQLTP